MYTKRQREILKQIPMNTVVTKINKLFFKLYQGGEKQWSAQSSMILFSHNKMCCQVVYTSEGENKVMVKRTQAMSFYISVYFPLV